MSHTVRIEAADENLAIKDLAAMRQATERCGLAWHEDQRRYKRYSSVMESCLHAISHPTANSYEIGVVKSRKYPGAFDLALDSDISMIDQLATGKTGGRLGVLLNDYQIEASKNKAKALGMACTERVQADGTTVLTIAKSGVF